MSSIQGRARGALLSLVILTSLLVRGWDITSHGPKIGDEASYILTAQTLVQPASWAISRTTGQSSEGLDAHMRRFMGPYGRAVGFPPGAQIGFYGFVAAVGFPLGFPPYTGLLVSVLFGTLGVGALWLLTREFDDTSTKWISVALLAASPYHILYSRLGLANATAATFLVAGAGFIVRSWSAQSDLEERRALALGGCCLGGAFLIHPGTLPQIGLFWLAEGIQLVTARNHADQTQNRRRLARLSMAILLPILAAEIVMWIVVAAKMLLLPSVGWNNTYLTSLVPKLLNDAAGRGLPQPSFQVFLMNLLEGTPSLVLAAIGSVVCIRRFASPLYRLVALQTLVPLAFWSFTGLQVARTFVPVLPFWCCLVSVGLVSMCAAVARRVGLSQEPMVIALAGLLMAARLPLTNEILQLRSGWAEATEYVRELRSLPVVSTQRTITQLYLGIPNVMNPPTEPPIDALRERTDGNRPRYLLVDVEEAVFAAVTPIRERCSPVASFANPALAFWPMLADQLEGRRQRESALKNPRRDKIDVFDLDACLVVPAERAKQE